MNIADFVLWLVPKGSSAIARIRLEDADGDFRVLELERLPLTFGRSPEADIQLADCWVSKLHCTLEIQDGALVVRDLESRNGTLVNREIVNEQTLGVGDRISIGRSAITVLRIAGPNRLQAAADASHTSDREWAHV